MGIWNEGIFNRYTGGQMAMFGIKQEISLLP